MILTVETLQITLISTILSQKRSFHQVPDRHLDARFSEHWSTTLGGTVQAPREDLGPPGGDTVRPVVVRETLQVSFVNTQVVDLAIAITIGGESDSVGIW